MLKDITNFKKYTIVDNDRPKLCTDRLDGLILTALFCPKAININDVEKIIDNTQIFINEEEDEEIGFTSSEVANIALNAGKTIDIFCHSKEDNYMMELLASITRDAIDNKYITYDDLYSLNEKELINILENCNNKEITKKLTEFMNIKKEDIPEINLSNVKIRALNPLVNGERLVH